MAKIRMRDRHPNNKNTNITVIHSDKGNKLRQKTKNLKIGLVISVLLNICLIYLLLK